MAERMRFAVPAERTLRLWAGIVLFTFLSLHLFNAGLLLFGLPAAGVLRPILSFVWESWPGAILLYGSFVIHPLLALKRVALRRTFRMPASEALQLILALSMSLWIARHIIALRGTEIATGVATSYRELLTNLNSTLGVEHAIMVVAVWAHGCIGIASVLRLRPWFRHWRHLLLAVAILLPAFALAGFVSALREVALAPFTDYTPAKADAFNAQYGLATMVILGVYAVLALVIAVRFAVSRAQARVTITYANGPVARGMQGMTLLEISRSAGVPHAAVCGGKARCSTCRVRIIQSSAALPGPAQAERRLLSRIGAPDAVRLACQLVPAGDIGVERLVEAGGGPTGLVMQNDPFHWGVERRITLMFADIRGFTAIAERHFAYDIVFTLNRFQADMASAIEQSGGRIDKYLGDGLMAIFGSDGLPDAGARAALDASALMLEKLERLNAEFETLLTGQLRIGIGLHTGTAILGRIGGDSRSAALTALGDSVNVAARLEEMTKTYGAVCVASAEVLQAAYGRDDFGVPHEVTIRGRAMPLAIRAFSAPGDLPARDRAKTTSNLHSNE